MRPYEPFSSKPGYPEDRNGDTLRGVTAEHPAAGMPARTRSTIAIFVAGAGLVVLLTVIVDTLLIRRKARESARTAIGRGCRRTEIGFLTHRHKRA